jgi:hypothetical protein
VRGSPGPELAAMDGAYPGRGCHGLDSGAALSVASHDRCKRSLVAANALLRRNAAGTPPDREGVAEQERNATHPVMLHIANFCAALSAAFFVALWVPS